MKITKNQLRKIIQEEIKRTLFEDDVDDYDAKWEACDIITMYFDDEDIDVDTIIVDAIIEEELNHAVEALKIIDPRFDFLANKCGINMNKPDPWAVIKEPMPRTAQEVPAWNYIENVDINDGRLEIELKPKRKFDLAELPEEYENKCREAGIDGIPLPGGRDVFPEEFWKHLEEDINHAIHDEIRNSA